MRKYVDMRGHIKNLEAKGLLKRVERVMNKDTEIHPLVRWQYRGGLRDSERMGFLFENVIDARGRRYLYPVAVGVMAGSNKVYATGLGCKVEEVLSKWQVALEHPIEPVLMKSGSVHEVVMVGKDLTGMEGGLYKFPFPISTPGFDNAPYSTCSNWVTKDPETGIQNIGNYRGHIKAPNRIGVFPSILGQDIYLHWEKCKKRGIPLEAALVIGPPPVVSYAAVEKVPYGVDEMAIAGGLAGEPIEVVKCKTVDLVVPADAELVIEGKISTEYLEPEGPFGESHGYMHPRQLNPYMDVTAITHRELVQPEQHIVRPFELEQWPEPRRAVAQSIVQRQRRHERQLRRQRLGRRLTQQQRGVQIARRRGPGAAAPAAPRALAARRDPQRPTLAGARTRQRLGVS